MACPLFVPMLRQAATWLCTLAFVAAAVPATAQPAYPSARPISLIVPYPAGGPSDAGARRLRGPLADALGTSSLLVENIAGATGAIAGSKLLAAPADGLALFYGSPNEVILGPLVNSAVRFTPEDFSLVHPLSTAQVLLLTRSGLKAHTVEEFIALARATTDRPLSYGSVGQGSLYHLIAEYLGRKIGASFTHVPYKGAAPALQDLMGGQIDFAVLPHQAAIESMAEQGRLRILSTLSHIPSPQMRQIKPLDNLPVLKDIEFTVWGGIFVRKGTPPAILAPLHAALVKATANPEWQASLEKEGRALFTPMSQAEAEQMYRTQIQLYRELVRTVGFKPQ